MNGQDFSQSFPTVDAFRAFMVNKLGSVEIVRQSLYDTIIYPTAGLTNMTFFALPQGQGITSAPGGAAGVKSIVDTNMTLAGQLPAPQGFFVESVEVDFQPGSTATANTFALQTPTAFNAVAAATVQAGENDVNAFYTTGALTFVIGQKNYLQEASLVRFPPKARFELDAAVASNSATTAAFGKVKLKAGGRPYQLRPGLSLMTSQNFAVTLNWPIVVATPSGFNGAVRVILDGWLFRAVQ
jgi:hypothetical protein